MRQAVASRPVKIVYFYNWTNQDFTGKWDKTEYYFAPGEKTKMEDWKAEHFATHLVDQFIDSPEGKATRLTGVRSVQGYKDLVLKSIILTESSAVTPGDISKQATELLDEDYPEPNSDVVKSELELKKEAVAENPHLAAKKTGRPKKNTDEETFEGLKQ